MSLPAVSDINWIGVNYFEFWLNDAIGLLIIWFIWDFLLFNNSLRLLKRFSSFQLSVFSFFLCFLVSFDDTFDVLLQFSFSFAKVHVFKKFILLGLLSFNKHFVWSFSLTVDMLQNFVVGWDFLFVFSNDTVDSVDSSVRHELFKLWVLAKSGNVRVENNVISHTQCSFSVLIWLSFTNTVR